MACYRIIQEQSELRQKKSQRVLLYSEFLGHTKYAAFFIYHIMHNQTIESIIDTIYSEEGQEKKSEEARI